MSTIPGEPPFSPFGSCTCATCTDLPFQVGDLIVAKDDLDIVNDCLGEIIAIDKAYSGEFIYTCKFDMPEGTFLLKEDQLGEIDV